MATRQVAARGAAADCGTELTFTETGAFFDGHEKPELREQGSGWILDVLGKSLAE